MKRAAHRSPKAKGARGRRGGIGCTASGRAAKAAANAKMRSSEVAITHRGPSATPNGASTAAATAAVATTNAMSDAAARFTGKTYTVKR
jgi:hypothetical protein